MDFDSFVEKHKNLIYAPLDIEVPHIDVEKLIAWGIENKEKVIYEPYVYSRKKFTPGGHIYSKEEWLGRNDSKFWQTYYVRANGQWLADFDVQFPKLKKFFKTLPLTALGTCGYLYQNPNLADVDTSPVHTDEAEGLGMRLTIGQDISGLYFHKIKKGVDPKEAKGNYMVSSGSYDPLNEYNHYKIVDRNFVINETYLESEKIFATPPKKFAQLFVMTNDIAPHAAIKKDCPRVTFAFFGKSNYKERFNWQELDQMLIKSKEKYQDNFIYL
jgi:hypothetical protein